MLKAKILRGQVLESLYSYYPDGIDDDSIHTIFFEYNQYDDVTNAVNYLLDKKLIKKVEAPHAYIDNQTFVWYKITPEGIDVFEHSVPCPAGILLPKKKE